MEAWGRKMIEDAIADGWELHGGVSISIWKNDQVLAQALIKKEDE